MSGINESGGAVSRSSVKPGQLSHFTTHGTRYWCCDTDLSLECAWELTRSLALRSCAARCAD
jgi:hypothetical protein